MTLPTISARAIPLFATLAILVVILTAASIVFDGFCSRRVISALFTDHAFLGVVAIGMTFVILSGGIDLSVGAVVALAATWIATAIESGVHPIAAMASAIAFTTVFGAAQGALIHTYRMPPFLVTLAGMFCARGLAFVVSPESRAIAHPFYEPLWELSLPLGGNAHLPLTAWLFLAAMGAGWLLQSSTRFGRNVYAVGGAPEAARLMGLPIARTVVPVYALSGLLAGVGGVVVTLYMGSGNPAMGRGLELDAIACVVIGGTRLSGGLGSVAGTLMGVLIFGTLQTAIVFDGRLSPWWSRIVMGLLLLLYVLLQRGLMTRSQRS